VLKCSKHCSYWPAKGNKQAMQIPVADEGRIVKVLQDAVKSLVAVEQYVALRFDQSQTEDLDVDLAGSHAALDSGSCS
jgi:hypothetical protein